MLDINNWLMTKIQTVHFVGIGGIGMSGLAEILLKLGFNVQGSDLNASPRLSELAAKGATIFYGHDKRNIHGADVVVFSSAVPAENPEREAARNNGIPEIRRAELLAELMRISYGIAVAGTHGKTTTTSLIAVIMEEAGLDPTVVVGGNANNIGTNSKIGEGKYFVVEADESDASFLLLTPVTAVVTNIEKEHMEYYRSFTHLIETFSRFLKKVPFYGSAVVCGDDETIRSIMLSFQRRHLTYGMSKENDLYADEIKYENGMQHFQVFYHNECLGEFRLKIPGQHMILNSLAAIGVALEEDVPVECIKTALLKYSGVKRRMDVKGQINDVLIIDDYAHHPTEIKATLNAVRQAWSKKRVNVVFQPHRYTRTKYFMDEFADVLSDTDRLIIVPIYHASEKPITNVNSEKLIDKCRKYGHQHAMFQRSLHDATNYLQKIVKPGEIVLTLGAGDVFKVGDALLDANK